MTECVIVALPREDSQASRISSEKIAHMTLLYLGELDAETDTQMISEIVEHATSQMQPFGASVSHRGTLGDDHADVLYLAKNELESVVRFRSYLLTNEQISRAYNKAYQHPSWTPHVTLGYPDAPARPIKQTEHLHSYVEFDRIAVWYGDFEGPTFRMTYDDETIAEHSMADIDDFLAHHGVKGMKWGVRKDGLTRSRARAVEKDRAWIEDAQRAYNKVATSAAMELNKVVLPRINAKYAVEGKGVRNSEYDAYINELTKAYEDALDKRMYAAIGRSPSGKHSLKWHADQADIKLPWAELVYSEKKMAHADTAPMIVRFVQNEDGTVKVEVVSREEFESSTEEVEHSMVDNVDDFLAHYGVKGMRWGVRKARDSGSGSRRQKKSSGDKEDGNAKRNATKPKNELSKYSDDKLTSMTAKLKGPDALSDAELKKLTGRMQLEQTYRELQAKQPKTKSKSEKFLDGAKLLGTTANQLTEFMKSPAGKALQSKLASRAKK